MRRLKLAACVVMVGVLVLPSGAGARKHKPFSGQLCPIVSGGDLASAHITAVCVPLKTIRVSPRRSPLGGTAGSISYVARWGNPLAEPSHSLFVTVAKEVGSGNALRAARKHLRAAVLSHGTPVAVGNLGSFSAETMSCNNPPTTDCTSASVTALVGEYLLSVQLADAPPTDPAAPLSPGDDESEDKAQQESDRAPAVAIAKAVAARL